MNHDQLNVIWKNVLGDIESHYTPAVFKTWFKHSRLISLQPGKAELAVENIMTKNFIVKYAEERLVASISAHSGVGVTTLTYTIEAPQSKGMKKAAQVETPALFETPSDVLPQPGHPAEPKMASNLNPKYTFDTFIVGNRNRLAHAAARAVAERPGTMYNPLYFYGGVGLGKTHLMQAVGNEVIRRDPNKRVLYVSCETFLNEFVTSIKTGKQENFKKKYRNVDVFLVDDIQFITGKDGTQEEFFHTFNALYQTDKQIIITSDKAPSEIKGLEDRLSSRFSSGMIADMQLPDLETRQAILLSKCQEKGITLPDSVILYIADQVESNIRELEGALMTVILHVQASGVEPTLEEVQKVLRTFITHKPLKKSGIEQICDIVCEYYSVDFKDIKGQCRERQYVKPRQILMYLLKNELGMTFPMIGREIGGRDHTTAMHSVDKIEKEMKKSPELLEELQQIKELFYVGGK